MFTDELDSYMFQTVGHQAIDLYAEAMNLQLYRHTIEGGSVNQSRDYTVTLDDEVEDLFVLLSRIKVILVICLTVFYLFLHLLRCDCACQ